MSWRIFLALPLIAHFTVARAAETPGRAACVNAGIERKVESVTPLSAEDLEMIQRAAEGGFGPLADNLRPELRFFAYLEKLASPERYTLFAYTPNTLPAVMGLSVDMARVPEPQRTRWTQAASQRLSALLDEDGIYYASLRWMHGAYPNLLALAKAAKLPKEREKEVVRKIAAGLADDMITSSPVGRAYAPKLYQFAKRLVRQQIGLPSAPLTDLIVTRNWGRPGFKIVSTDPIESGDRRSLRDPHSGLYVVDLEEVTEQSLSGDAGKTLVKSQVEWKTGGRTYRAQYEAVLGREAAQVAPAIAKLDYDSQWKDGKYTGLVMPGANMGDFGPVVLDEYKSYYKEAGFRFQRARPVSDFKKFLQTEIESGRLDYWLKEAHAEGSDRELSRLVNEGSIVTGTKKLPDGREEVIHLYYAKPPTPGGDRSLSYSEVALWLGKREQGRSPAQLAYFDTSCFGLSSACPLMTEAGTPKLVVIGSEAEAETFTNEPESPLLHILSGIRARMSFGQIREKMAENSPTYRLNQDNTYRFPDEPRWQSRVQGRLPRIINVRATVTDSEGKPYSVEDAEP